MKTGFSACLLAISICMSFTAFSQTKESGNVQYPEVGKPMPDFVLKNIKYYSKTEATLTDFKGKWLMLDFWNKGCGACVASFPGTNEIQKNLSDQVQVMLVGIQDKEGQIQLKYAHYREKENLILPCAFDSSIAKRFDIYTAPHIVLIDDKGIVRCITTTMNTGDIRDFIAGNSPDLPKTYKFLHDTADDGTIPYDMQKPFMVNGNGAMDSDFLFRSVLAKWNRNTQNAYYPSSINEMNDGRFEILGTSLEDLYKFAFLGLCRWDFRDTSYYGRYYDRLIFKTKDSSLFKGSYKYNRNLYSYSLIFPKSIASKKKMQEAIQSDLANYLGYDAVLEERSMPCWKLLATKELREKLRTKGGPEQISRNQKTGITTFKNWSILQLFNYIVADQIGFIVDETNIDFNIDISLSDTTTGPEDIKTALELAGFRLVPTTKLMKVIIIRDKTQTD